jgi:hypothetical protein
MLAAMHNKSGLSAIGCPAARIAAVATVLSAAGTSLDSTDDVLYFAYRGVGIAAHLRTDCKTNCPKSSGQRKYRSKRPGDASGASLPRTAGFFAL